MNKRGKKSSRKFYLLESKIYEAEALHYGTQMCVKVVGKGKDPFLKLLYTVNTSDMLS